MAKIPFHQLTNGEKYKTFKKRQLFSSAGKWASTIGPLGVLFGVKFNEYFQLVEGQERVKLTIGCVLAIIVACFVIFQDIKKSESTKHLSGAVGWSIALVLCWLLKVVLEDLILILAFEASGQWAAVGLNAYSDHCKIEADEYKKLARADGSLGYKTPKKKKVVVQAESDDWF